MGGTLCFGAEEDCEDGEASDLNLIAALTISYEAALTDDGDLLISNLLDEPTEAPTEADETAEETAEASWLFTAKVSHLDIKKAVTIISGGSSVANKIPDIIGNIGLTAIQNDCVSNSTIDDCYFLIAVSTQRRQPEGIPVVLQPGLSITARPSSVIFQNTLVSFNLPLSSSNSSVYAPGESIRSCIISLHLVSSKYP